MSDFHAITKERHSNKRWRRFQNYKFASSDAVAPLVISEFGAALLKLPIAFIEVDGSYVPVAVMGLESNRNFLVNNEGRWGGGYLPECYRCYPFVIAKPEGIGEGERVVCVDEGSGLVIDESISEPEAERFFTPNGELSEMLEKIKTFLIEYANKQVATEAICNQFKSHNLFKEWTINWTIENVSNQGSIEDDNSNPDTTEIKSIDGLYCIDQDSLNGLEANALVELRETNALLAAHGQIYSMVNMRNLVNIAKSERSISMTENVSFDPSQDHGIISFEGL